MNWLQQIVRKMSRSRRRAPSVEELHDMIALSPLFKDVPTEHIRELLSHAQTVKAGDADVVMREGEEGDYYYIILDGMASVVRRRGSKEKPKVAAVLAPGHGFGEEALISNTKRNATVIMETDGMLLRIPKQAFIDYVMSALVAWVSALEAQKLINSGARWLDTRPEIDHRRSHLPEALSMPTDDLRERSDELDRSITYVCYCENGRASAAAAFLMHQAGYSVCVLQGGLKHLEVERAARPKPKAVWR